MSDQSQFRCRHTEHQLFRFPICPVRAEGVRLFHWPEARHRNGVLREIPWSAARRGDLLLAVVFNEYRSAPTTIPHLAFWHVVEVEDDLLHVEANVITGCGSDAEYLFDRFAGLLGLPPSEGCRCH